MKRIIAALVLMLMSSASFAYDGEPMFVEVITSPKTLAICGAADVATTAYAVSHGLAKEANPLLAPSVNAHHFARLLLAKAAYVGLIWWIYEEYKESKAVRMGVGVTTAVTCGAAINNAWIISRGIR